MIKLDIINEVVNKTGITKTKAELAVETVFASMKKALAGGERIVFDSDVKTVDDEHRKFARKASLAEDAA